jgi:hypothetical protein
MGIEFSNVNIESINFINWKNDVKFDFLSSIGNLGESCGHLICKGILSLKLDTNLDENDSFFPQFICDISIEKLNEITLKEKMVKLKYGYSSFDGKLITPNGKEYYFVRMEGGEYDISVICESIEISKIGYKD